MNFYKDNELVIILGVTPFIALTDSAVNGLGIGILVLIIVFFSYITFSFIERHVNEPPKTLILIIINATIASILASLLSHYIPELYNNLVIFIPLLAVNSFVLQNFKKFDNKSSGIKYGFSLIKKYSPALIILFIVGLLREIFGKGMVLNKPFLNAAPETTLIIFFNSPVGAFIVTGIVIAFYSLMKRKNEQ